MEWRFARGRLPRARPGDGLDADALALVAGEEPTPLQRTLVAADVGNGISAVLDFRAFIFINVDLTVHLERMPEGEWVCVDAVTRPREAASAPPSRCSPTGAGGSAAPSRPCSSRTR